MLLTRISWRLVAYPCWKQWRHPTPLLVPHRCLYHSQISIYLGLFPLWEDHRISYYFSRLPRHCGTIGRQFHPLFMFLENLRLFLKQRISRTYIQTYKTAEIEKFARSRKLTMRWPRILNLRLKVRHSRYIECQQTSPRFPDTELESHPQQGRGLVESFDIVSDSMSIKMSYLKARRRSRYGVGVKFRAMELNGLKDD